MGLFRKTRKTHLDRAPLTRITDSVLSSRGLQVLGTSGSLPPVKGPNEYSSRGTLVCLTPYSRWYWIESLGEVTRYDVDSFVDREAFNLEGAYNTRTIATQRACRREYDRLRKEASQP